MNDSEQRAQEIERQIGRVGIYFRFSVEQGMQSDRLGPVADLSEVVAQTESYLEEHRTSEKIGDFIRNFDTATRRITLDQLRTSWTFDVSSIFLTVVQNMPVAQTYPFSPLPLWRRCWPP
jgi:hypothetical protein